jgi:hypothetical protein
MSDEKISSAPQPELARLVRLLIEKRNELDPWLPFPQSSCSFAFGDQAKPMPIGALLTLWDNDPRWRRECPNVEASCAAYLAAGY